MGPGNRRTDRDQSCSYAEGGGEARRRSRPFAVVGKFWFFARRSSSSSPPASGKLPWIPAKLQSGRSFMEVVFLFLCEEGEGFCGSFIVDNMWGLPPTPLAKEKDHEFIFKEYHLHLYPTSLSL